MQRTELEARYGLVIVGGGVTGAGAFLQAAEMGLSPLLVEARDFAWGTSSRSSKMVHGGLRYLKQGKFLLTRSAVRERERLLHTYPGLVTPLEFIMPVFDHLGPSKSAMKFGLSIYSLMAGQKQHCSFTRAEVLARVEGLRAANLVSAVGFRDAQVDDARLVLRLIQDGCRLGGTALNYTKAQGLDRNSKGEVRAIHLADTETGRSTTVRTRAVINATGPFAETLHPSPMKGFHIRPLRGSHLVFPGRLLPLDRVISFIHPRDSRPVFLFPWEGCTFLGTTDVDHGAGLGDDPRVSREEADYLMEGLAFILPGSSLSLSDAVAAIAGVRPVLSRKKQAASRESREHVVWRDKGLVTVTGGKLTTFKLLAADALKAVKPWLPEPAEKQGPEDPVPEDPVLPPNSLPSNSLPAETCLRLSGRYGSMTREILNDHGADLLTPIGDTRTLWAEICHGAAHEQVRHLSDLLLRRVRLGLFLPGGGEHILDKIQALAGPFLPWDDARWRREKAEYLALRAGAYSVPDAGRQPEKAVL